MIQQRARIAAALHLFGDLAATAIAFFGAWALRFELEVVPLTKNAPGLERYLELLPIALFLFPVVFYFHGLYRQRLYRSRVDETVSVLLAVILGTVLLSGLISWYRPARVPGDIEYFTYSRWFMALFAVLEVVAVVALRVAIRGLLKSASLHAGKFQRILVVGAGELGLDIATKLLDHRDFGVEVVGFLDDDPEKRHLPPISDEELRRRLAAHGLERGYLLFVGNPKPHKNLDLLLEAFAALESPSARLVVVGDKRADGREPDRDPRVRRLGRLADDELPAIYRGASALLFPSLYEGFGLPVAEAMAAGVAVIASSTPAVAEIAGRAALLVDPSDREGWTQAIHRLGTEPGLREELAANGPVRAREFRWEETARKTLEVYRAVLATPESAA